MQHSSRILILSISLVVLPFVVSGVGKSPIVGGWQAIENIHDPHVIEIAKFAVAEYDKKSKANLKFEDVVKGESQVVAGMNYRLVLKAKDGSASKSYQALVWEKPWENFKQLTSFDVVKD